MHHTSTGTSPTALDASDSRVYIVMGAVMNETETTTAYPDDYWSGVSSVVVSHAAHSLYENEVLEYLRRQTILCRWFHPFRRSARVNQKPNGPALPQVRSRITQHISQTSRRRQKRRMFNQRRLRATPR